MCIHLIVYCSLFLLVFFQINQLERGYEASFQSAWLVRRNLEEMVAFAGKGQGRHLLGQPICRVHCHNLQWIFLPVIAVFVSHLREAVRSTDCRSLLPLLSTASALTLQYVIIQHFYFNDFYFLLPIFYVRSGV